MKGYKGFKNDFSCLDKKYEVGKTYEIEEGKTLKCCPDIDKNEAGLHFCENPLEVFNYYDPAISKFAEVEAQGETVTDDNKKFATSKLFIKSEISLNNLINAGVKFILSKVEFKNSAATNTGKYSAATNTGDQSAATNTGYQSAATVEGKESVAISLGIEGKAKGNLGSWIVLAEWELQSEEWHRINVKSFKVDGERIKADTFYILKHGEAVKVN